MQETWQPKGQGFATYQGAPPLVSRILGARGFLTQQDVDKLLNPSLQDLSDPLLLQDMDRAVARLTEALKNKEKVAVYADFDLDGTSGLALLARALRDFGFENLVHYQPLRLSEGYGLHASAVEGLAESGVKVIVTVDVGITAHAAAQTALALGVDLIITDHHLPENQLPPAFAIVNPNRGTCPSQLGHLSGAGVAFYLVLALKRELEKQGLLSRKFNPKELLDCFVIGTLTDLVPLIAENRVLVKHGLLQLQTTQRPGLRHLMERLGLLGRPLTSSDVAIGLAPKLNALSRMELGLMPRDVLMIENEDQAQEYVDRIIENNEMRKHLQKLALETAREMALKKGRLPAMFLWSEDFHKGVVGLIATQLAKDLGVPCFIGSCDAEGVIHGSSRVPDGSGFHLVETLKSLNPFLLRAGGHAAAAGFALRLDQADAFEAALLRQVSDQPEPTFSIQYDTHAELSEMNSDFMSWYERLEPFGKEFPPVLLRLDRLLVADRKELKGGHLKFTLGAGRVAREALLFQPPESVKRDLAVGAEVSILAEPQWNHFRGDKKLQLLVRSMRPS